MATIQELAERIDRLVSGSISTDEGVFDNDYLYSLVNTGRAFVLRQDFLKFRRWSPQAIQTLYPEFDINFQDSVCYSRFQLPSAFIQANAVQDGLVYCGSSSSKIMTTRNFRRIKSRTELADFLKNPKTTPASGKYVAVLIEGLLMTLISKDIIKEPMITGVFDTPNALETFNLQRDFYPISEDMIPDMETFILKSTMGMEAAKDADVVSDSADTKMRK